jgi:hypothetical protein
MENQNFREILLKKNPRKFPSHTSTQPSGSSSLRVRRQDAETAKTARTRSGYGHTWIEKIRGIFLDQMRLCTYLGGEVSDLIDRFESMNEYFQGRVRFCTSSERALNIIRALAP